MSKKTLVVGNSDGIGLATTRKLLTLGWDIVGISRSASPIEDPSYEHIVADVQGEDYLRALNSLQKKSPPFDLCLFCVGIGEVLDLEHMDGEAAIFDVNLMALVKTVSAIVPSMLDRG